MMRIKTMVIFNFDFKTSMSPTVRELSVTNIELFNYGFLFYLTKLNIFSTRIELIITKKLFALLPITSCLYDIRYASLDKTSS